MKENIRKIKSSDELDKNNKNIVSNSGTDVYGNKYIGEKLGWLIKK